MLMMTGSSNFLKLAPEVLIIPLNGSKNSNAQLPDDAHFGRGRGPTKEEKIGTLVHGASHVITTKDEMSYSEAVSYLDMADGDVDRAITNVREDFRWSAEEGKIETVIAGTSETSSSSRIIAAGRGGHHRWGLTHSEVRAYLEMADWDVDVALGSIREDFGTLERTKDGLTYYYGGEKFDRGTHVRACARMDETFDLRLLCSDPWKLGRDG